MADTATAEAADQGIVMELPKPKARGRRKPSAKPVTRRPRAKAEHIVQLRVTKDGESERWVDTTLAPCDSTDAAVACVIDAEMEGDFRVVAVKRVFSTKKQTKLVIV